MCGLRLRGKCRRLYVAAWPLCLYQLTYAYTIQLVEGYKRCSDVDSSTQPIERHLQQGHQWLQGGFTSHRCAAHVQLALATLKEAPSSSLSMSPLSLTSSAKLHQYQAWSTKLLANAQFHSNASDSAQSPQFCTEHQPQVCKR